MWMNSSVPFLQTVVISAAGYSTDRGEKYHVDISRSNTLDLKDRKKRNVGSVSELDGSSAAVPMAGFEDDRNLTAVDHTYENEDVSLQFCYFLSLLPNMRTDKIQSHMSGQ